MLLAFKDVVARSQMFADHHVQRQRLGSVSACSDILARLGQGASWPFTALFNRRRAAWASR